MVYQKNYWVVTCVGSFLTFFKPPAPSFTAIRAISSTIFDFEFSIWAISRGKMVEHFNHEKISNYHRAISSISQNNFFEQNWAFFKHNQAFLERFREIILLTPTSTICFNWIEKFSIQFVSKYGKHIYFSFSQPK